MKDVNVKSVEKLAKTCYNGGLLPIFLGILVVFVDLINRDIPHVAVGLFIFITGYSLVKISSKLTQVLKDEGV